MKTIDRTMRTWMGNIAYVGLIILGFCVVVYAVFFVRTGIKIGQTNMTGAGVVHADYPTNCTGCTSYDRTIDGACAACSGACTGGCAGSSSCGACNGCSGSCNCGS